MAFLPGVVGSNMLFAPAIVGAGRGIVSGAGAVLRSPGVQGALGGLLGAGVGLGLGDEGVGSTPLFRPTMAGMRANSTVLAINPASGRPTFFRHVGTPLLFTGDLTIAKRVRKVASRAARKR